MLYPTDEQAGYPEQPICPICGRVCDTVYKDDRDVVGCDRYLKAVDAWEEDECFPEREDN